MTVPIQVGESDAYIFNENGQIVGIRRYHPEQKMWIHIHFSDVPNADLEHEHTLADHMPDKHKQYAQWNAERFIAWAEQVGPYTAVVIRAILTGHRVEQQGYRACMGVLKLADRYSLVRVEAACSKALGYTPNPGFKHISTILKSGQDRAVDEQTAATEAVANSVSQTRTVSRAARAITGGNNNHG